MRGTNPLRSPEPGDGRILQVQDIFPTLQGEGPFAGEPAVFVRLGGCNLACDFCDTEFEIFRAMPLDQVMEEVRKAAAGLRELAVITGGEPLRQNIAPLCKHLLGQGFRVQIETNGTLFRALPEGVSIVCSPKPSAAGYYPVRPDLLERVNALKFIVSRHRLGYGEVAEVGQTPRRIPVYVQPMDEADARKNAENRALAMELAQARGYRLSLQLHKILGIP